MKVELSGTWPSFSQFYELAIGKSGAASIAIKLSQTLEKELPTADKITPLSEAAQKAFEEVAKDKGNFSDPMEIRGIILHKIFNLIGAKVCRRPLIEFFIFLLNNSIYPKVRRCSFILLGKSVRSWNRDSSCSFMLWHWLSRLSRSISSCKRMHIQN